jgi:hypothetical protein
MTGKSSPASPFSLDLTPKIAPLRPHNPNIPPCVVLFLSVRDIHQLDRLMNVGDLTAEGLQGAMSITDA